MITNGYMVGDCFLSTDPKVSGSTMIVSNVLLSSNSTTAGDPYYNQGSSQYYVSITYPKPDRAIKYQYQCMFYNPTTVAMACAIFTEEVGLSTGSTQDYLYIDTVTIPASTATGRGRALYLATGLFNGVAAQFRFYNPSTFATADASSSLYNYMAIKEYV